MNSTRTIPGRPAATGSEVVDKITDLVAETLDQADAIDGQSVRDELATAAATIGLLALGGHLRTSGLVLISEGLRLGMVVPVGEDALAATEDTRRPRLAQAAAGWTLHLPSPDGLGAAVNSVARACPHLSTAPPPDEAPSAPGRDLSQSIDLTRLKKAANRS